MPFEVFEKLTHTENHTITYTNSTQKRITVGTFLYLLKEPGTVILFPVTALMSLLITSKIGPIISVVNFELYFSVISSLNEANVTVVN